MENLPSTYVQCEKYPFLPDYVFMPIEAPIVPEEISGRYGVNKRGEIKNLETDYIMKPYEDLSKYLIISFKRKSSKSPLKLRVHRIVAEVFLYHYNPEECNIVNHINFIKGDNNLSNLEWVTCKENLNPVNMPLMREEKLVKFVGYDNNGNEISRFSIRNVPKEYSIKAVRHAVQNPSYKYKGLNWKRELPEKTIYGFSGNLDDYEWHEHWKYPGLYVCKEGFIKYNDKLTYCCDEVMTRLYVIISINNKKYYAHRVIMEFLLNRDLGSNEFVDHINTIRYDNSFNNLRLTDAKGNINNEITIKLLSNDIIISDLFGDFMLRGTTEKVFKFVYETDKYNSVNDSSTILRSSILNKKYIAFKSNDYKTLLKKLERVYYLVDKDKKNIIGVYLSLSYIGTLIGSSEYIVTKDFKNRTCNCGYYILLIHDAKYILKSTGHLTALNPENNQSIDI